MKSKKAPKAGLRKTRARGSVQSKRTQKTASSRAKPASPADSRTPDSPVSPSAMNTPGPAEIFPETPVGNLGGARFAIPDILFEGDEPVVAPPVGPGQKFLTEPALPVETEPLPPQPPVLPSVVAFERSVTSLEEQLQSPNISLGGNLWLTPRDPHCLYAHWDFDLGLQQRYNELSIDGHLVLRLHETSLGLPPDSETHLSPLGQHCFAHISRPGSQYLAALGYYDRSRQWVHLASSERVHMPVIALSEDKTEQFASLPALALEVQPRQEIGTPVSVTPSEVVTVSTNTMDSVPHQESVHSAPAEPTTSVQNSPPQPSTRFDSLGRALMSDEPSLAPATVSSQRPSWTPVQTHALENLVIREWVKCHRLVFPDASGRPGPLSAEPPLSSLGLAPSLPTRLQPHLDVLSSPGPELREQVLNRPPAAAEFWLQVNAELVVYGATEPDARVTIGGRPIRVRADGTFSCRFSLPDGNYELPISARSRTDDSREAELRFNRCTHYQGHVTAHPQDPALKSPSATHWD